MFREMRRKNRALPQEECIRLLTEEKRGVLSVMGDDGYPYGVPINHWYCPENGHLYFHGGRAGHRVDAADRCDKASFCTWDAGWHEEGEWALHVRSVIVFGRLRRVTDHALAMEISRRLSLKFTDDLSYIEREIERSGPATLCFELIPEHMTGKAVLES